MIIQTLKKKPTRAVHSFGSMPRLSSSRRNRRLIQPERLSSPSSFMAILSRSKRSASSLSCTEKRSFLLSLVDIVNLKKNNAFMMTMYTSVIHRTTPRTAGTVSRRLTNNVMETNAMAKPQCNQTHPKFTWLFLAVSRSNPQDKPHREEVIARSEREARLSLAGRYVLSFAGRLPARMEVM